MAPGGWQRKGRKGLLDMGQWPFYARTMGSYIGRRLFYMVLLMMMLSFVAFSVIQLPPGDWIDQFIYYMERFGVTLDESAIEALNKRWGFKDPFYVQYWKWITNIIFRGDFGESAAHNKPVADLIGERIFLSIVLSLSSMVVTYLIAVPIGIYSATHPYSVGDYSATVFGLMGLATPNFLLALILMFLFQRYLGWSPGGLFSPEYLIAPWSFAKVIDLMKHLPMPLIIIGTAGTAGMIRVLRTTLMDELGRQYVVTARAKGVAEGRLLFKYPIRLAINPMVSGMAGLLAGVVSGEALVSIVLSLPTVGPLLLTSLLTQDLQIAASLILFLGSLGLFGTLLSDLLLVVVDPRIRFEKQM